MVDNNLIIQAQGALASYQLEKPAIKISGNRRSFVCRILQNPNNRKDNMSQNGDKHECHVVQFTGYIKYEPYSHGEKKLSRSEFNMTSDYTSPSPNDTNGNKNQQYFQFQSPANSRQNNDRNSSPMNSSVMANPSYYDNQNNSINTNHLDKSNFYLIMYGQIANYKNLPQQEFVLKFELGGKIIYCDPQ